MTAMTATKSSASAVFQEAIDFLQWLRPKGPWQLIAIPPDGKPKAQAFDDVDDVRAFCAEHDGKRNLYYSVNPTRVPMSKKAEKDDIAAVEYMLADLDPNNDETPEAAKERYLSQLNGTFEPQPSAIIDSGNGIQALWRLEEPLVLGELDKAKIEDVEARSKALMTLLGGKAGTQNIDRILRLPGTTNLPTKTKLKAGRVACPTRLMQCNGAASPLTAFERQTETPKSKPVNGSNKGLPRELLNMLFLQGATPAGYPSRSELFYAFVCGALRKCIDENEIIEACTDPTYAGCSIYEHVNDNGGEGYVKKQIERAKPANDNFWERMSEECWSSINLKGSGIKSDTEPALTVAEWLTRDLPDPDFLLGDLLSTTCRVLWVGPTGLGKTNIGLAMAFAMVENHSFLHWGSRRKCRVLFVDGEMSTQLMKRRLHDAVRRSGGDVPEGLVVLSKEDFENMPPLNTSQGQKWIKSFIKDHGPFDFIIFDNIQALLIGEMRENEQWANVLPWVRSLTRRTIGQMWFHHTGHDETKSYGDKSREWQMDTVVLMERVKDDDADICFTLNFTKARERNPENRDDFAPVTIRLKDDTWSQCPAEKKSKPPRLGVNEQALLRILAKAGPRGLTKDEFRKKAEEADMTKQCFFQARLSLENKELIWSYEDDRWSIKR